ncbi:MAG: response regulator transcription factor [Deltaproteobacteria bacterium]|nr:response regulator transcription factor [Deltaproteobacteria bacterium]
MATRIVLADDHAIFRQGLRSLLRQQPDVEVVAEVERAADLLGTLAVTPCDLLLLDLQMERWMMNDIEHLSSVTRVIVLTASERIEDGLAAIRLGARAIVQKRFGVETLMEAIRAVQEGLVWMPATLQAELASQLRGAPAVKLTTREGEVVRCVALGMRNAEIAERCQISEATVKTHINNIFAKLDVRDRVELTRYAFRTGLLSPRE